MKKIKFNNIVTKLFAISFIFTFLLTSVHFWCFNEEFYANEHSKLQLYGKSIAEHIGIKENELNDLTSFVLDYLNDPDASLDKKMTIKGIEREVFTDDEKTHMVDVRTLNLTATILNMCFAILCVLCALYIHFKKIDVNEVYLSYKKVLKNTIIAFAVIGIWVLIDFNSFWTLFHKIFFAGNDLWILDLRKDVLIMIVPPQFFNDLVLRIIITFVLAIGLQYVLLYIYRKKLSKND